MKFILFLIVISIFFFQTQSKFTKVFAISCNLRQNWKVELFFAKNGELLFRFEKHLITNRNDYLAIHSFGANEVPTDVVYQHNCNDDSKEWKQFEESIDHPVLLDNRGKYYKHFNDRY
ncbi:unnamed protein product [Caenorhabditis angaria]|uniref:Galectin n=1 Tax=Caenorhabditis angaria TaxID=860376 RepID=A0A9P1IGZ2_9PELO|nr:unnamed protein product [Caenorhabditis angaria]